VRIRTLEGTIALPDRPPVRDGGNNRSRIEVQRIHHLPLRFSRTLIPGRTKKQWSERWKNALDPSTDRTPLNRTGRWAEDEDIKLQNAVKRHGGKNWDNIAALVPHRTKDQYRNRWKRIPRERIGTLKKAPALGLDPHSP
jgi:hypothetical protein